MTAKPGGFSFQFPPKGGKTPSEPPQKSKRQNLPNPKSFAIVAIACRLFQLEKIDLEAATDIDYHEERFLPGIHAWFNNGEQIPANIDSENEASDQHREFRDALTESVGRAITGKEMVCWVSGV